MSKFIKNQKIRTFLLATKPWVISLALLLVLRYTGILAGISFAARTAIFKTGIMDFRPDDKNKRDTDFDYDFSLTDLQGHTVDVSQFKGKVIFLNMWATWCGPCRIEMPSIEKLYQSVDHDKIVFIMLSIDEEEQFQKIVNFINDKQFTFPVYVPHRRLPKQLKIPTIPTTFVITKDGKISVKKVGTANYNTKEFREYLEKLSEE